MKDEYDFRQGKRGAVLPQHGKTRITIYIDDEVLEAFRQRAEQHGTGYQTMMNQALREYLALSPPLLDEATLRRVLREELQEVRGASNAPPERRVIMTNKRGLRSEITQLFLAACNFAEMAKASYAKLDQDYQTIPISTLGKRFDSSNFNEKDEVALFTLSYVSSSAIRISTIFEAIGLKPTAKELYKKGIKSSDRASFLCHYLRDNVCHREPAPG